MALPLRVSGLSIEEFLMDIKDIPTNPNPEDWSDSIVFKLIHQKPIKVLVFLQAMERAWKVAPIDVEFGCMQANLFAAKF